MRHGHNKVQKEDDGWGKIHIIDGMGQGGGARGGDGGQRHY